MILESKPSWSLIDGKLGVAPPQGAAARAIYFLQQHKIELHPLGPMPCDHSGEGLTIHIEGTSRPTFVMLWHGFDYEKISGGMWDQKNDMEFDVENVKGIHISQLVPPKEGVQYDGLISLMGSDGHPISIGNISLMIFQPRLVWAKRLKLYKEHDECDEY